MVAQKTKLVHKTKMLFLRARSRSLNKRTSIKINILLGIIGVLSVVIQLISSSSSIRLGHAALPSMLNGGRWLVQVAPQQGSMDDGNRNACAINFFGLPRAFSSLVLPSLRTNVIRPNPSCDFFVHYYVLFNETAGRSGSGGEIQPHQIRELKQAVQEEYLKTPIDQRPAQPPIVRFRETPEAAFWEQYRNLTQTIRTEKSADGKPLYFPYLSETYESYSVLDNIIKMWHSIEQSFMLMEEAEDEHANEYFQYDRVAMLRSDVVYLTPIEVFAVHDAPNKRRELPADSNATVFPDFSNWPVNDRAIIGPRDAVAVWATQRFSQLNAHVHRVARDNPGYGLHSERFVAWTLIPLIEKSGGQIAKDVQMCFSRARADETIWTNDCTKKSHPHIKGHLKAIYPKENDPFPDAIEAAIGRPCRRPIFTVKKEVTGLWCPENPDSLQRPA